MDYVFQRAASLCVYGFFLLAVSACFRIMPNDGGGMADYSGPREVDVSDIAVPEGYAIEVVATDLTFPSAITFDDAGRVYVTEAGYSYGGAKLTPKLLRIEANGEKTTIAEGDNPPWNGVTYHNGAFYVAGGHLEPGQIMRISQDGEITTMVDGLPSMGDHFPGGPVVSSDGWLYFSQGTATNSGVVGKDNFKFGWPKRYPNFHDIPCEDVVLAGVNHKTPNFLSDDLDDKAITGAFVPFGVATTPGQVIPGQVPCSGAIMRVRLSGGEPELVAWGFRNLYGMAWAPDGSLYVTENQYDARGSRPVFGTGDLLWKVIPGRWYGWPDFFAGQVLEDEGFEPPYKDGPRRLLAEYPGKPPQPAAVFGVHSSSNGMDFSRNASFGFEGEAFVAQFGDMAPSTGKVLAPMGFNVVRVDLASGVIHDFASNKGETSAPASYLNNGGLERPLDVQFNPNGTALYIADFGVMTTKDGEIEPHPGTGVLWRVVRKEAEHD